MSTAWQSKMIQLSAELEIHIQADPNGVTFGKTVGGTYASDLLLTPKQARQLAADLLAGAHESESAAGA